MLRKEDILNNVCGKKYYGSQWGPETVSSKYLQQKKETHPGLEQPDG